MEKIGIIGFGNMGRAIGEQLKINYRIYCFDKDPSLTNKLSGIQAVLGTAQLLEKADAVILSVKPQDFDNLLEDIKPYVKDRLIISIAAGITTAHIEKMLGIVRVIRAMPNMPAKIGQGVTCLSKGRFATEEDFEFAQTLFTYLGETLSIEENLMNAATAVSGSGPGYCYDFIEAENIDANDIKAVKEFVKTGFIPLLKEAAISVGFNESQSVTLAAGTGSGCIALLIETKLSPGQLKKQVASKGGTTEAGLEVLHNGGSLKDAVKAALKRAEELSKRS